jgi:hypothetical protein
VRGLTGDKLKERLTDILAKIIPERRECIEIYGIMPATDATHHPIAYRQRLEKIENQYGDLIIRETVQIQGKFKLKEENKDA